jgi:hypothetical protein
MGILIYFFGDLFFPGRTSLAWGQWVRFDFGVPHWGFMSRTLIRFRFRCWKRGEVRVGREGCYQVLYLTFSLPYYVENINLSSEKRTRLGLGWAGLGWVGLGMGEG